MGIQPLWESKSASAKLTYLALIAFASVSILSLIGSIIVIPLFGINVFTDPGAFNNYNDPMVVSALKVIQIFNALGLFIIPSIIAAILFANNPLRYLELNNTPDFKIIIATVILMISALPIINFLAEWNNGLHLPEELRTIENWMRKAEDNAAKVTEVFLRMDSPIELVLNLFMIGLLAAIGEELLFRGLIQKLLGELTRSKIAAIWIAGFLFSALHMQFFGFIPRMLLGVLFGYLLVWSGSLWVPILAHFTNNGFAVIISYLTQRNIISPEIDKIGAISDPPEYLLTSMGICLLCGFIIYRTGAKKA